MAHSLSFIVYFLYNKDKDTGASKENLMNKKNAFNMHINLRIVTVLLLILSSNLYAGLKKDPAKKWTTSDPIEQDLPLSEPPKTTSDEKTAELVIKNIIITGNESVKEEVILKRLPYKVGDKLDPSKSNIAINNLYLLGYFRQVQLEGERLDESTCNLHVILEEKKLLDGIEFNGNKKIKTRKIKEKLNLNKLATVDEETIRKISLGIKDMYKEEDRHLVKIDGKIIPNKDNPKKATAVFTINEGPKSSIKRVHFVGNKHLPDRKLRTSIFSRENWLLKFMDSAGTYQEDAVEIDKYRIESLYRDYGYLTAKVYKTKVKFENKDKDVHVTFYIKEGKQFIVEDIHAPGDEIFTEEELLPLIFLEKGHPFSQTKLTKSINRLKELWGEKGYIYADVYPQVKPDEKTCKVDITFHVERGNKMYVNRINVTGNKVTRDKVVRRQLEIVEGDLITTPKLSASKSSVEYLSFFEREGVNWKIHRISDELADLEMNVKEAKTGNFNFMLSYGSDQSSPGHPSLKGAITVEKLNLFGLGYDIGGLIQATRHHVQRVEGHIFDPHLFDSNVSGGFYGYKHWDEYEFWKTVDKTPIQQVVGADVKLGFGFPKFDKHVQLILDLGIEKVWNNKPKATGPVIPGTTTPIFEPLVKQSFTEGTLKWIGADLVKDTRNHQIYPSKGYKITLSTKAAPATINDQFSFLKAELEMSNYTALIGEDSLVLALRAKGGRVSCFNDNKPIPYKELFHMGGQTTVRGFTWGSVGPGWITGDPLGGRNAVLFTAELIFPLIEDYAMKGHFFYDAGAGWDTPKNTLSAAQTPYIIRDNFNLRHAIGFGLNLLKPMAAKIDWGFKLDRRRSAHESPHEFHLSMNHAF